MLIAMSDSVSGSLNLCYFLAAAEFSAPYRPAFKSHIISGDSVLSTVYVATQSQLISTPSLTPFNMNMDTKTRTDAVSCAHRLKPCF